MLNDLNVKTFMSWWYGEVRMIILPTARGRCASAGAVPRPSGRCPVKGVTGRPRAAENRRREDEAQGGRQGPHVRRVTRLTGKSRGRAGCWDAIRSHRSPVSLHPHPQGSSCSRPSLPSRGQRVTKGTQDK